MGLTEQRDRMESLRAEVEERLAMWLDEPHEDAPLNRWRGPRSDSDLIRDYRAAWRDLRAMEQREIAAAHAASEEPTNAP